MSRRRPHGPLEEEAGHAVRAYVDALHSSPRASPARSTHERARRRLAEIELQLRTAPPMRELMLVQERLDLWRILADDDPKAREDAFVAVARAFGRRHGITYEAWREIGVPAAVLRRARIHPTPGATRRQRGSGPDEPSTPDPAGEPGHIPRRRSG